MEADLSDYSIPLLKRKAADGEIESLRARWLGEGASRRDMLLQRLRAGMPIDDICEQTENGLYDMRGFPFPYKASFENVAMHSIDCSYSTTDLASFTNCTLHRCSFAFGHLDNLRLFGGRCVDVSFEQADFCTNSGFGGKPYSEGCSFERVRFNRARMWRTAVGSASFLSCDFSNARLSQLIFRGHLEACVFAGMLSQVEFSNEDASPDQLRNCDFRAARFKNVTFDNCDFKLGDLLWPTGLDHYVVTKYVSVLQHARAALKNDPRPQARTALLWLNSGIPGDAQEVGCISGVGLEKDPIERALLDGAIDAAISACGARRIL